jgi:uncharacterized protein (DUF58 family)
MGSTAQAGWLFVLAAGVLAPLGASFVTRLHLAHTEVERVVPPRARLGTEVRVGLTLTSPESLPLGRLEDDFGAFEPVAVGFDRSPPGGTQHIELVRTALRRGVFDGSTVALTSGAPFGLVRRTVRVQVSSPMTVVPSWVELTTFPILEPSSSPSDVVHERARTGAGEEYLGVREYRPGDPRKFVHWRSTARAGKLIVREYEREVSSRVGLVLAGSDHGTPPDSSFESLVAAAASIGLYALSTGHPVDAMRADPGGAEHIVSPGRNELLDWLAAARAEDIPLTGLVDHVLERIRRRGTIVLLTPDAGAAGSSAHDAVLAIQRAGARAIVVLADSKSWAGGASVLARDLGSRAPVRRVGRGQDLAACLRG